MKTVSNTHKPDRPRSAFCEECGLSYMQSPSDRRRHRKYHEETVYGLAGPSTSRIIWWEDGCEVSVVVPSSPIEQKMYAEKVARVAKRGTPFDWPAYIAGDGPDEDEGYVFMLHTLVPASLALVRAFAARCCGRSRPGAGVPRSGQ